MNEKYSDEFKLKVVQDYYNSPLGVRSIALKYTLPSKNYINNWEKYLIKKGLLPPGSTKPKESFAHYAEIGDLINLRKNRITSNTKTEVSKKISSTEETRGGWFRW